MKTAAIPLLFLPAGDLSIDYTAERTLEISIETAVSTEITHFSMERDGEPREGGRFGGGGGGEFQREVVYRETVLEHEDGVPTKVRRAFGTVEGERAGGRDGETRSMDSPMEDVTLILSLDAGKVVARTEDGEADREEMLAGHRLENLLDGLLPADPAATSWEPDADGIAAALLLDVERALFPPREIEQGERGGRRGGPRGVRRGGSSPLGFLREARWDAEAELTEETETIDDLECAVIELTLEAEGELPDSFGGRGGRDRAFGPEPAPLERVVENTYEVELTGHLYFSLEERRPVRLELEGELLQDSIMERETPRGEFRLERTQEGILEHTITLTASE